MKAILEFNLPEERTEHLAAVKSQDMTSALFDIINNLPKRATWHFEVLSDNEATYEEVIRWMMEETNRILFEYGVDIDELTE